MILNRQRRIRLSVGPLLDFFARARRELGFPEHGVTVRLVSDAAMARLNRVFRGEAGPTDVLSFRARPERRPRRIPALGAAAEPRRQRREDGEEGYFGDIAISPETARRNARRLSRDLSSELRVLILHGMIHLAGYDHERDDGQMEKIERKLRRRLGLRG